MSLARALTKRIRREEPAVTTSPNGQIRYAPGTIRREMISSPTELLSTTNVQALTAPDIAARSVSAKSSSSSVGSSIHSDFSTIDRGFLNATDDSFTDISSPGTPLTPPSEHSKDFFNTKPITTTALLKSEPTPSTPAVPMRSASHSKQAHVEMSRNKSVQRRTPPPENIDKLMVRNSAEMFGPPPQDHPFGRELAKVNETAEDFGAITAILEEEEQELVSKGLYKFSVDDYINEIMDLYRGGVFEDNLSNPWL
ncbi:hypothetical protein DV737_g4591, partial [Chaetothyriales sp. CBS 132003]